MRLDNPAQSEVRASLSLELYLSNLICHASRKFSVRFLSQRVKGRGRKQRSAPGNGFIMVEGHSNARFEEQAEGSRGFNRLWSRCNLRSRYQDFSLHQTP